MRKPRSVGLGAGPLLALLLVAALPWGADLAAGAQEGTTSVEVSVTHGDGSPVAEVPVTLEVHDGREPVATLEGTTDDDGRVTWGDVPAAPGYHARATASWSGVRYPGPTITLAADEPASIAVQVFETSSEGRPLHLDTLHLIVQVEDPALYRVLQFMTVSNAAEAAYAGGPELEDGRRAGVVIPLPAGTSNLAAAPFPTATEAIDLGSAEVRATSILDPRPIPPSGRQVAVTYDLTPEDGSAEFSYELPYPTASVSLLVGGPAADSVEVESPDLESRPAEQIGEQNFDLWAVESLQPGSTVTFTLGPAGIRIAAHHWALVGLAVGLLLAVAGTFTAGTGGRGESDRDTILRRIAALDVQHDAGEIGDTEYFERRAREIERLALLERMTASGRVPPAGGETTSERS